MATITKLALQQANTKLAADNLALREMNSVLTTERDNARAAATKLTEQRKQLLDIVKSQDKQVEDLSIKLRTQIARGNRLSDRVAQQAVN